MIAVSNPIKCAGLDGSSIAVVRHEHRTLLLIQCGEQFSRLELAPGTPRVLANLLTEPLSAVNTTAITKTQIGKSRR